MGAADQPEESTAESRPKAILVVEDDILIRSVIADHLRDQGFAVIETRHADDATTVMHSQVIIDLVFSDINMPGAMDGQDLAAWMYTHHPSIPVILTSGAVRPTLPSPSVRRFIPKPYEVSEVERHIREVLQSTS